jgi:hypothetical protein
MIVTAILDLDKGPGTSLRDKEPGIGKRDPGPTRTSSLDSQFLLYSFHQVLFILVANNQVNTPHLPYFLRPHLSVTARHGKAGIGISPSQTADSLARLTSSGVGHSTGVEHAEVSLPHSVNHGMTSLPKLTGQRLQFTLIQFATQRVQIDPHLLSNF